MNAAWAPGLPYRLPSLARRLVGAVVLFFPLLVLLVGIPTYALSRLGSAGIHSPLSLPVVTSAGLTLSLLAALRYISRPTRLYGPVAAAASAAAVMYLLAIAPDASFRLALGGGIAFRIEYATFLRLLIIPAALGLLAAIVTTFEDFFHPGERYPFDFPA